MNAIKSPGQHFSVEVGEVPGTRGENGEEPKHKTEPNAQTKADAGNLPKHLCHEPKHLCHIDVFYKKKKRYGTTT